MPGEPFLWLIFRFFSKIDCGILEISVGMRAPFAPHMSCGSRANQAKPEGALHPVPSTRYETSGDVSLLRLSLHYGPMGNVPRARMQLGERIFAWPRIVLTSDWLERGIEVLAVCCARTQGRNANAGKERERKAGIWRVRCADRFPGRTGEGGNSWQSTTSLKTTLLI
jgi:hypothetical protein